VTAPRVTYSPASEGTDPLRPFVMDVMGGRVVAYMTRSQLRVLVNDCEAAAALDREARQCPGDTHDFVRVRSLWRAATVRPPVSSNPQAMSSPSPRRWGSERRRECPGDEGSARQPRRLGPDR